MKFLSFVAIFTFALGSYATPLENLKGTYTILEADGVIQSAGLLEIFETGDSLGYSTTPLAMAAYPVIAFKVSTAKELTTVEIVAETITQKFSGPNQGTSVVEYLNRDGVLYVSSETCATSDNCVKHRIAATTGKALGEKIDPKTFFQKLAPKFVILTAGQKPPHTPEASQATVDATTDPEEADLEMPFCTDTGCDPGMFGFIYKNTEVYAKRFRDGRNFYSIVTKNGPKILLFGWEESQGLSYFRNFQYSLQGNRVSLEYQLKKAN